jgi:hypothetical protein
MCSVELKNFKIESRLILSVFISAVLIPALCGCGSVEYGRLKGSREVTEIFVNNQVLPDCQYYYNGFQTIPYGLIGIDKKYNLHSKNWKPIDMNPILLNHLIYRMRYVYRVEPRGAWILDHDGNRLGIWYSSQYWTKVKREKDNQIIVVTPTPPDLNGIP